MNESQNPSSTRRCSAAVKGCAPDGLTVVGSPMHTARPESARDGGVVCATRVVLLVLLPLSIVLVLILLPGRAALPFAHDPECPRWRSAFMTMPARTLVIRASENRRIPIPVKLAATDEARWAGFQCATHDEIRTTIILFDFGKEALGTFHMRNVRAPLDIAFAKESGRIFSTLRMRPSPTREYGPPGAFRYAIEARAGFFEEKGILVGYSLVLEPSE